MRSRLLWGLALAVNLAAAAAFVALPAGGRADHRPLSLLLLAALAAVAGARPVRFPSLRVALTVTHPVVLCCLAALGPRAAAIVALAGVAGATVGELRRPSPVRLVFNMGAVVLAAATASWVFALCGGLPGAALAASLGPLVGATTAYFLANSGLVSLAASVEQRESLLRTWSGAFSWTAASYFTGLTLATGMLFLLQQLGPWGLLLGLPPVCLILSFYRAHRDRLDEKQRRIDEVERLNVDLHHAIRELRDALEHVKRLQGLLPICMHCKSVRDDEDAWQRIEVYLQEHSDVRFTHSLCDTCRQRHYPAPALADTDR